jgi:hypothetical protein
VNGISVTTSLSPQRITTENSAEGIAWDSRASARAAQAYTTVMRAYTSAFAGECDLDQRRRANSLHGVRLNEHWEHSEGFFRPLPIRTLARREPEI